MRFLPLAVLFFVVPLVEIFLLINVGQVIGAWWTILAVVGTAVIGAFLIRAQGLSTMMRMQTNLSEGRIPAVEILEGICIFVAGAMLMTPGFFTDAIGFALLIPPLRRFFIRLGLQRGIVKTTGAAGGWQSPGREATDDQPVVGRTLETEYRRVDPAPGDDS